MDRLTVECWRNLDDWECCGQDNYCKRDGFEKGGCHNGCIVPKIYYRLAKYEDTGLTPEEVAAMKAEYSGTFQAHLNELLKIKDKQIAVLQALCEDMENTAKEYRAFKEFFDALYGYDLMVENWHLNGALEPFDNFYDKAVDEMRKERHNADTV